MERSRKPSSRGAIRLLTPGSWFFAPASEWRADQILLPEEESHHALRVMRIAPPDVIAVTDGQGRVARCAASSIHDDRLVVEVLEIEDRPVLKPQIAVYQGAPKGHKADAVVERLAELGIAEICVFESRRSVVRWDPAKLERLEDRWTTIARSAAKQSRNAYVTQTSAGVSWNELIDRVKAEPLSVVLWEEASFPLRVALEGHAERIALIIGPEGGFARDEAEALADSGSQLVSLGPHILRTENAAVVTASAVLFHYGLIG